MARAKERYFRSAYFLSTSHVFQGYSLILLGDFGAYELSPFSLGPWPFYREISNFQVSGVNEKFSFASNSNLSYFLTNPVKVKQLEIY